jgi:hypothetical protein
MLSKLVRLIGTLGLMVMLMATFTSPAGASNSTAGTSIGALQRIRASQLYAATTQTLISLTSPILHGANATIIVRSKAGAHCSITVYYKSGPSKAAGLGPQIAATNGRCAWTWKVGTNTTPGTWRIVVKTDTITKTYPFVVK